jgi:hypothetical protein
MANAFTVLDNNPEARRQQLRWNGHNFSTNNGGTKYLDGTVASPAHTDAVKQCCTAGAVQRCVVNFVTNNDTGGDVSFLVYQQDPGGGAVLVGTVGPYTNGATGVQSTALGGSHNDGALLWIEAVSSASVNSNDGTAYAVVEYWTTL